MKKLLRILGLLLVMVGCNHTSYYANVKSQTVGPIENKSYFVMPLYKGVKKGSIKFVQNSKIVDSVLTKYGMSKVNKFSDAEIVVRFGYGITSKQKIGSYTTYDTSTVNTTSTTQSVYTGNTYTTTGTAVVRTPRTKVYTYTEYSRSGVLSFIDNSHYLKTKEIKELSRLEIFSNGTSSDLNEILNVVLRASLPYIGTNRASNIKVVWDNHNKKFIKLQGSGISEETEQYVLDYLNKEWLDITG